MMPATLLLLVTAASASAPEPWPPLSGGTFTGPAVPLSPDPLVRYVYGPSVNRSSLQVFPVLPVDVVLADGTQASSFENWQSLSSPSPAVTVAGPGGLVFDFGVELPAWLELDSPDLSPADLPLLTLGTSEYNEVDIIGRSPKQGTPVAYAGTYRLETNAQLYEGVRYGFLSLSAPPSRPFTITGLRAVTQAKPVNYTGSFSGSALLTAIWYTAAYTVRTNLEVGYMGAILEDRGDRISWAGDAHVSQASSLAAFGNSWDVLQNLAVTGKSQNGIASYSLYWTDSVMDYSDFTSDAATLALYRPHVEAILTSAASAINRSTPLTFFGWDDRLGSGFQNASCAESQWAYKLVLVRLLARWGQVQAAAGNASAGAAYAALADQAWGAVKGALTAAAAPAGLPWHAPLGLHAAAEALSTQRCSQAEAAAILSARFNDSTSVCSLSNFNQWWLLRGLGAAGALDRGLASVALCWGGELAMGGTTFWEISSPDWAAFTRPGEAVPNGENGYTSLCHPWSSAPTAWLSQQALGVRRAQGGGGVLVAPHCSYAMAAEAAAGVGAGAGADSGAVVVLEGRVPVGEGLAVAIEVQLGGLLRVTLPPGTNATLLLSEALLRALVGGSGGQPLPHAYALALPTHAAVSCSACTGEAAGLSLPTHMPLQWASQGSPALPLMYTPPLLEASGGAVAAGRAASLALVGGGSYTIEVALPTFPALPATAASSASDAISPFPPPFYPAPLLATDWVTRGSWQGVYGSSGGVLFGLGGSQQGSTDLDFLPPWVASVTGAFAYQRGTWASAANVSDARALQVPGEEGRSLGYLCDNFGGDPTYAVDVRLASPPPAFTLALYAVDWDSRGRRGTVAVLDGGSLNPITPIQGLRDYSQGVWLVYNVTGSSGFRVRVSQTRGDNAPISAMLFN